MRNAPLPAKPTLQEASEIALQASPGRHFSVMFNVDALDKPLTIGVGDDADDYRWIDVDRASGAIRNIRSAAVQEAVDPSFWIGLHQGHRFGSFGKALFALSGLMPMALYATGLSMWWKRRSR